MKRGTLFVVAAIVATLMIPVTGQAASSVGSFEIDGNTTDSAAGEPLDWDSPGLPGLVTFDDASGNTDDTFAGSKENVPDEWDFVTGSTPGKTDITGGAVATREIAGQTFVYVNFTRAANTGDTFASFEFNTSRSTFVNSEGYAVPVRTAGDRLLAFFATNGGQVLNIQMRSWVGNHLTGSWQLIGSGVQGVDWDAAVNADQNGRWTFAEAAVNFSAFGFQPSCPGSGRAWIKTTTAATFETASLADRTAQKDLNLTNCATKNFSFTFSPAPIAGTKVFAIYTVATNETRSLELTDPDANGSYTGADDQVPPGTFTSAFQVRADADGNGQHTDVVWTSPQQSETFLPKQSYTNTGSLPYTIALSPAQAENFAGRPHLLTATVTHAATGDPLPFVPVSFGIASSTPANCGALSAASAYTDAQGQATTTLTSPAGCTVSVRAWVDGTGGTGGFDQGEANATAGKTFVVYSLSVAPPAAVNEPGTEHTFTVTLGRDTGSGASGYAGQTISLTLDPGVSDAHFVRINGADASGTSATCVTQADGTCSVTIVSSTPGTSTLLASYTTINDSGEGTVTSTGGKTYVDYRVNVSPPAADNEVGDEHTVTVTIERDEGNGFVPAPGVAVTLTLDPGGTDAHLVSIDGNPASGTTGSCTTSAAGTCSVVFVASTAGSVTLSAAIGIELDSGTLRRSGTAAKVFSDFLLTVSPSTATNEVGDPHTFTITLQRNDGNGFFGYAGQTVSFTLDPGDTDAHLVSVNGEPASGLDGTCVTGAAGTCEVVIVATTAGGATLTAGWTGTLSGTSSATRSGSGAKTYIAASLVKASCPVDRVAPGGAADYTLAVALDGADLHNASLVDHLPAGFRFASASPAPTSAPAIGESGDVVWDLGTLAEGSNPSFTIRGSFDPSIASGTTLTNTAILTADEIAPKISSTDTLISSEGASASGRAFGVSASGLLSIPATPDTDTANPGEQIGVHALAPAVDASVLTVGESGGVEGASAQDTAIATAASASVNAGGLTLYAEGIVARSSSTASGGDAGSTAAGSTIGRLVVNGTQYENISEPVTIRVPGPTGDPIAEVRVLEEVASGSADGKTQPSDGLYQSGLAVNGLHVMVLGTGLDVVVAHAESAAAYPSGLACGATAPSVAGDAFLTHLLGVTPELAAAQTGLVRLPSTGGEETRTVSDVSPLGVAAGTTLTHGRLDPLEAGSMATVTALGIGPVTATMVKAKVGTAYGSSTPSVAIGSFTVNGMDVCAELGLTATCEPDPNTVLLLDGGTVLVLLNEQISDGAGMRVNAIHIFVIGRDNPLGLPAGAELIISSAYSNTFA